MDEIKIGLLGFGTVGSGVGRYLLQNQKELEKRTGVKFTLCRIAEKDRRKFIPTYKNLFTTSPEEVLSDPEIQVVIELIGGIQPAKEYILKALKNGKHVITANKALLAEEGKNLFEIARRRGLQIKFEASVGAGIPIIKGLKEALIANKIETILGIVNGTCNYILTTMEEGNIPMSQALKVAQEKGYAERDPRLDIEGIDSVHKLAILIKLAFGYVPNFNKIYTEGIRDISLMDVKYANELGYRIKLLAIAKRKGDLIEARVHPTLLPLNHMLSSVRGVYNAVYLRADLVGEMLFYGQGAGKFPTTSAVISDLVDLARDIRGRAPLDHTYKDEKIKGLVPMSQIDTRYYIRFMAVDKPGVLAKISGILGSHNISIASVTQKERRKAKSVPIVMMTHEANERNMMRALKKIEKLDVITDKPVYIRVEEG
jgi:homoserine dehydrogenase